MKVAVDRRESAAVGCDVSVVGLLERAEGDEAIPRALGREASLLGEPLRRAWESRELKGKLAELTTFHRPDGKGRILFVGLGRRPLRADAVRSAAAKVVQSLKGRGARTVAFRLASFVTEPLSAEEAAVALASGAALGAYQYLQYKSASEGTVEEATVALGEEFGREESRLKRAIEQELRLTECALYTRDLANTPPNVASPAWLAESAERLAKEFGLKVSVFDETKLRELGCEGILAVGSGSVHPPRMVVLEYPGGARSGKTVAVVGKGITFDSGGISIKPSLNMAEMKFDKAGACAVLGIVRAAALLKVPPRVIGVLACAENLPGGSAYRPSDLLRSYNGVTIEVLDTDAEGRLVLSDALGYVVKKYDPDVVIDLATLTGAALVALGEWVGALVATHEELARSLENAGTAVGEPLWRMPLTDAHREMVKSDVADVRNVVEPRYAGVLIGAAFLEHFVGGKPWAHLDIAGPAYARKSTLTWGPPYQPLGATGFGVRLVSRYLLESGR